MAYSNLAQLRMLVGDPRRRDWGVRAVELAEELGRPRSSCTRSTTWAPPGWSRTAPGADKLEHSLALALDAGLEEHVARAYTNLGATSLWLRDHPRADGYLREGIAYCAERDLDSWLLYITGHLAWADLDLGRWDECAANVSVVLVRPDVAAPSRITALAVLGHLRARRGDPGALEPLDEALELRARHRRAPARGAGGRRARRGAGAGRRGRGGRGRDGRRAGPRAGARRRLGGRRAVRLAAPVAGITDDVPREAIAQPYRLELEDAAYVAAALWREKGCAYAALALAHCPAPRAERRALAELQAMGARPAARRVERALRERGIRDLRRGPRATTRENPAGLTARGG